MECGVYPKGEWLAQFDGRGYKILPREAVALPESS